MAKEKQTFTQAFNELANSQAVVNARKTMIANRLKTLRVEHMLTHADVAKGANIKPLTYSGYENAHNNTPIEALVRLAIFYDVSLDYLCCRTDNKKGCYTEAENSEGEQQKKKFDELLMRMEKLENAQKQTKGNE